MCHRAFKKQMTLNHNKFNEDLVFVLVLLREKNRSRVQQPEQSVDNTTPWRTLAVQNGKSLLPIRGHFFIPMVTTSLLKIRKFYTVVVSYISREVIF